MITPPLSLDCLTLTDSSPIELIEGAHAAGFDLVSLWVHLDSAYPRQQVSSANVGDCAALLAQLGIGVHSLDAVELASLDAVRAARPTMELGVELGGKSILAYNYSNPDSVEVAEALALLAELADEFDLAVNLEPVAFGATATVDDANRLIDAAGSNIGILFDTYHFIRAGGTPDTLAAADRSRIRYVQINDGQMRRPEAEWLQEATQDRFYPGTGEFPLVEILGMMPRDVPWGVEAPRLCRMRQGISRDQQAVEAMTALRTTVGQAFAH